MVEHRVGRAGGVPPYVAIALGLAATALLALGAHTLEQRSLEDSFRVRVDLRQAALASGVHDATDLLLLLNKHVELVWPETESDFRAFTKPVAEDHPSIQGFNLHRIVPDAQRDAFERSQRSTDPDFEITRLGRNGPVPAPRAPQYVVVQYVEPLETNRAALGLDVTPNTGELRAMQMARETGRPAASPPFRLAQAGNEEGFVMVLPVYVMRRPNDEPVCIGDTAIVFRLGMLIQQILSDSHLLSSSDMAVRVMVADEQGEPYVAFSDTPAGAATGHSAWNRLGDLMGGLSPTVRTLDVGGQRWTLEAQLAVPDPLHAFPGTFATIAFGLALTSIGVLYLSLLRRQRHIVNEEVTARTAELQESNRALRLRERAIEASTNAIVIVRKRTSALTIEYANAAFEAMSGHRVRDVLGQNFTELWGPDSDQTGLARLMLGVQSLREAEAIVQLARRDGVRFWSHMVVTPVRGDAQDGEQFVIVQSDVSETRRYEEALEFQATHDDLTGLANRNLLYQRLREAMRASLDDHTRVWVLLFDLDRFKQINDTQGHHQGDIVIRALAARLQATVGEQHTVARFGGDEFVIVLSGVESSAASKTVVEDLMRAVQQPIAVDAHEYFLTCSLGIAIFPDDANDIETLLAHADSAMYRAKEQGRNSYRFFTAELSERSRERVRLERDLRSAIRNRELVLHYQPQIRLSDGAWIGAEALIRWNHPTLGFLPPARFLPSAEETDLIEQLGDWTLLEAARTLELLERENLPPMSIAVNISARQFLSGHLGAAVRRALAQAGPVQGRLEIELVEGTLIGDTGRALEVLAELKESGVRIALDDFGTGYSSLAYLRKFPLDVLKVDRSFVSEVTLEPTARKIVESIISLAHALDLKVVAEGVESREQLDFLVASGCEVAQGFYFARPMELDAFVASLIEQDRTARTP